MRRFSCFVFAASISSCLFAQTMTSPTATSSVTTAPVAGTVGVAPQPSVAQSQAVSFAGQAGTIAGYAQACGQDVSTLMSHVNTTTMALSSSNNEHILAMQTFETNLVTAQAEQSSHPQTTCAQILADYPKLPILSDDYQQTIIPKLKAQQADLSSMPPAPSSSVTPATPASTTMQAASTPAQQSVEALPVTPPPPPTTVSNPAMSDAPTSVSNDAATVAPSLPPSSDNSSNSAQPSAASTAASSPPIWVSSH